MGRCTSDLTVTLVQVFAENKGDSGRIFLHDLHFVRSIIILEKGRGEIPHLSSLGQNARRDRGGRVILARGFKGFGPWPFAFVVSGHSIMARGTCGPQWLTSL